jgi:hypothetical protein
MDIRTLLVDYFRGNINETINRISFSNLQPLIKTINNEIKNQELCGNENSIAFIDKYKRIKKLLEEEYYNRRRKMQI